MKPPLSKLALVALIFAFLLGPVGAILGIVAIISINRNRGEVGGMGLAIAAVVIGLLFAVVAGLAAAVLVPSMVKFQCRAKASEAQMLLSSLHVGEERFRLTEGKYGTLKQVGFVAPTEATARYAYSLVEVDNEAKPPRYTAQAVAVDPSLNGDTWQIDQAGQAIHTTDGCSP